MCEGWCGRVLFPLYISLTYACVYVCGLTVMSLVCAPLRERRYRERERDVRKTHSRSLSVCVQGDHYIVNGMKKWITNGKERERPTKKRECVTERQTSFVKETESEEGSEKHDKQRECEKERNRETVCTRTCQIVFVCTCVSVCIGVWCDYFTVAVRTGGTAFSLLSLFLCSLSLLSICSTLSLTLSLSSLVHLPFSLSRALFSFFSFFFLSLTHSTCTVCMCVNQVRVLVESLSCSSQA